MMPVWLETALFWWGMVTAGCAAGLLIAVGYAWGAVWLREWDADRRWLRAVESGHVRIVDPPYDWQVEEL